MNPIRKQFNILDYTHQQRGSQRIQIRLRPYRIADGNRKRQMEGRMFYSMFKSALVSAITLHNSFLSILRMRNQWQGLPQKMNHLGGNWNNSWLLGQFIQRWWQLHYSHISIEKGRLSLRLTLLVMFQTEIHHNMMIKQYYIPRYIVRKHIHQQDIIKIYIVSNRWLLWRLLGNGDWSMKGH